MGTSSVVEEAPARDPPPPPVTAVMTANVELSGNGSGDVPSEGREPETTVARRFSNQVDALISKADEVKQISQFHGQFGPERFNLWLILLWTYVQLEQRVKEVSDFYANKKQPNSSKGSSSALKDKIDGGRKEVFCSKKMQEVMRQFGTILKQARSDVRFLLI